MPLAPNVSPVRDIRGFDTDGHGTHVCGIACANGYGIAPEADLYVASVIESETLMTSMTRVTYGLDWLAREFASDANVERTAVLNMSLGFPSTLFGTGASADFMQRLGVMHFLIQMMANIDVLTVCAIGNSGPGHFGFPGGFPETVGVGAVDFDHQVADFSGSAPVGQSPPVKPDLVGYGVDVHSALERNREGKSLYDRLCGTSMASPYVAGIAALFRSRSPGLSASDVRDELSRAASVLPNEPSDRVGAGLARYA